jgi:hypothetical protein
MRSARVRFSTAGAVAAVSLLLLNTSAPVAADAQAHHFVVGYSQSNNAEPYRAQLNIQLTTFIKKYPDLKLLPITDAKRDNSLQISQVQSFISQKVDVLIVSPTEAAPLTAPVQQACAAHIPVIILDRTVNTDCYTSFIGGDNVVIGKLAGAAAVKLLPNGGNVVELRGLTSNQAQVDRDKGFRDGMPPIPKSRSLPTATASGSRSRPPSPCSSGSRNIPRSTSCMARTIRWRSARISRQPVRTGKTLSSSASTAWRSPTAAYVPCSSANFPQRSSIRPAPKKSPTMPKRSSITSRSKHHLTLDTTEVTAANAAALYKQYDFSQTAASR